MAHAADGLFESMRARDALEKYGAATRLTVQVYGVDNRPLSGPVHPTPLFELFARGGRDSTAFVEGLRPPPGVPGSPIVVEAHGVAVVWTALRLGGEMVGATVAGPVLIAHLTERETEQIARKSGLASAAVWAAARRELPVARPRLEVYGELLQVVAETILADEDHSRLMEAALARVEAGDRAKDIFLATLSHELRTPLTAIVGWTRMLRSGTLDGVTAARALDVIDRNTKLQMRLIEDLLDVSRVIAGKIYLDVRPVPLGPVIDAAVDAVRPSADGKGVRLEAALDRSVWVAGDRDRLGQIASNLLTNAVKFTPAGGRIEAWLQRVGAQAEITVSDTGEGIAPEFLPHLFERFRQAGVTTTRQHGGLGLGLALVRHLAEMHGGTVRAASEGAGRGTTFVVTLPIDGAVPSSPAPRAPSSTAVEPRALEGVRVLLVEDDQDTRELMTLMLQERRAEVVAVASAAETLKALDRLRPHVIVSDIGLPGEDGYALMRRIRAHEAGQGAATPAVAVTALPGPEHRLRALAAGYQRHLAKPVEAAALTRMVAELAGRA